MEKYEQKHEEKYLLESLHLVHAQKRQKEKCVFFTLNKGYNPSFNFKKVSYFTILSESFFKFFKWN